MKLSISNGVAIAIFYGLGVLTTYTFFKNKYEKKYKEEVEEYRERILKMYGINDPDKKEEAPDKEETTKTGKTKSSLDINTPKREDGGKAYYEPYKYIPPEEQESPKEEEPEDDLNDDPYEIDIDDYFSDKHYSKRQVTWYTDDNTYAYQETEDSELELMDDEHNAFGYVIESSGFTKNEAMVIYIRNPRTKTDYEVTKCYGAYNT